MGQHGLETPSSTKHNVSVEYLSELPDVLFRIDLSCFLVEQPSERLRCCSQGSDECYPCIPDSLINQIREEVGHFKSLNWKDIWYERTILVALRTRLRLLTYSTNVVHRRLEIERLCQILNWIWCFRIKFLTSGTGFCSLGGGVMGDMADQRRE